MIFPLHEARKKVTNIFVFTQERFIIPYSEKTSLAASLPNFSNPGKNYITEISLLYVLQGVETYLEA